MKKWLFNPFIYIAGARASLIGWAIMIITVVISCYSKTHFDGVLDIHAARAAAPLSKHLIEQLVDWGCLVFLFYPAALLFSRSSIRLIDIAGTMALARWPLIFPAIIGFGIYAPDVHAVEDVMKYFTAAIIALTLLELVFTIWMVALLYNAFSISSNMKGSKATMTFIGALLLAEIASKIILHLIHT